MPAHPPDPGKDPIAALEYAYSTLLAVEGQTSVHVASGESIAIIVRDVSAEAGGDGTKTVIRREWLNGRTREAVAQEMLIDLEKRVRTFLTFAELGIVQQEQR